MYALCFKTHGSIHHSQICWRFQSGRNQIFCKVVHASCKKIPFCEGHYKTVTELLLYVCDVDPDLLQLSRLSPHGNNNSNIVYALVLGLSDLGRSVKVGEFCVLKSRDKFSRSDYIHAVEVQVNLYVSFVIICNHIFAK